VRLHILPLYFLCFCPAVCLSVRDRDRFAFFFFSGTFLLSPGYPLRDRFQVRRGSLFGRQDVLLGAVRLELWGAARYRQTSPFFGHGGAWCCFLLIFGFAGVFLRVRFDEIRKNFTILWCSPHVARFPTLTCPSDSGWFVMHTRKFSRFYLLRRAAGLDCQRKVFLKHADQLTHPSVRVVLTYCLSHC